MVSATAAIILSYMAHECDRTQLLCEKNKDVILLGSDMEEYFYKPNAVHLNEQTFLSLKQLISDLVKRTS